MGKYEVLFGYVPCIALHLFIFNSMFLAVLTLNLFYLFSGMGRACHKASLTRILDVMQDLFPEEFDIYPKTWNLPSEVDRFHSDFKKLKTKRKRHKPTFICKPDSGSQGEGIMLIRDPSEFRNISNRDYVAQEYLSNIYLIDGYKFDLRIYAVLRSLDPLEIYICKEGLARFSTVPYKKPTVKNIQESFMHLTNYSLNKRSADFDRSENEDEGSKRKLTSVFKQMEQDGYDSEEVMAEIERVVCKTIIAIIPELKTEWWAAFPQGRKGSPCFQVRN